MTLLGLTCIEGASCVEVRHVSEDVIALDQLRGVLARFVVAIPVTLGVAIQPANHCRNRLLVELNLRMSHGMCEPSPVETFCLFDQFAGSFILPVRLLEGVLDLADELLGVRAQLRRHRSWKVSRDQMVGPLMLRQIEKRAPAWRDVRLRRAPTMHAIPRHGIGDGFVPLGVQVERQRRIQIDDFRIGEVRQMSLDTALINADPQSLVEAIAGPGS